ncbi:MAG TPA: hypothetical protein VH415_08395 [Nitrososphaeraceae archaeon]
MKYDFALFAVQAIVVLFSALLLGYASPQAPVETTNPDQLNLTNANLLNLTNANLLNLTNISK